jgi:hypothetical protein
MTIADDSPPTAGPATGSAVASATWQGTQVFAFPATDDGGGVYQRSLRSMARRCWPARSTTGLGGVLIRRWVAGCFGIRGLA